MKNVLYHTSAVATIIKGIVGLNAITKEAWSTVQSTEDKRERYRHYHLIISTMHGS
jgi:hypothetical protein